MQSHYEHMIYVLKYPEKFRQEFQRRFEILEKFELISQETVSMYRELLSRGEIPLWCGFLLFKHWVHRFILGIIVLFDWISFCAGTK